MGDLYKVSLRASGRRKLTVNVMSMASIYIQRAASRLSAQHYLEVPFNLIFCGTICLCHSDFTEVWERSLYVVFAYFIYVVPKPILQQF
jgi:hypothetical protein